MLSNTLSWGMVGFDSLGIYIFSGLEDLTGSIKGGFARMKRFTGDFFWSQSSIVSNARVCLWGC